MGRGPDSFQFYGGFGAGKRDCGVLENASLAAFTSLRWAGSGGGMLWLHNRFCSAAAGRLDAARLASAVEPSLGASRSAFCAVVFDSVGAHNGDGPDAARVDGGSGVAANQFRTGHRPSLWLEHTGVRSRRRVG